MKGVAHFPFYRQRNGWSCGAEVLRMGVKAVTGLKVPRRIAEGELGCKPDGVSYTRLKKVFRCHGVKVGETFKPTPTRLRDALVNDKYVVIDDDKTYRDCHVIMLPGYFSPNLVWCADPAIGVPTIRTYDHIVKSATEAFTLTA